MKKFRYILMAMLLAGGISLPVQAQVGEQRHNLSVGINGGVNMNSVSFSPTIKQNTMMGINGGLSFRYISEKYFKLICGAIVEVNYSQHGWDEFIEEYPDLQYTRTMNYVEIPLLAHLALGKDRGMQFFLHAGPQVAFMLGDSHTISGDWYTAISEQQVRIIEEQHDKEVDNKFDYGITAGAGVELRTKAGNFLLEGRYYFGLSDFYNTSKKDYFSRAAHSVITIKLSYLFDLKK